MSNFFRFKYIYIAICFTVLLLACKTVRRTSNSDYSFLYKKESFTLHPKYVFHHISDDVTTLHFSIDSKELLYAKQLNETDFSAHFELSYWITNASDARLVADSGIVRIDDVNNENIQKLISGSVKVRMQQGAKFFVDLMFTDLNKKSSAENVIQVEKNSKRTATNFLLTNKDGSLPLFKNYIQTGEEFSIKYREDYTNFYVSYFNKDFGIAIPPFSVIDPYPINFNRYDDRTLLLADNFTQRISFFEKEGIYVFQTDTTNNEGFLLHHFYPGFPQVTQADQMLAPLRYLTSKQEYDEMNAAKNKKAAVENFWINCAGNQDRAREVIKKFYSRVTDCNTYFSSYLEGWKTDRGMIYLVYGPPTYVYKNNNSELWSYGDANSVNALQFTFNKMENELSSNDYVLERSLNYKASWYRAVDIWRQGRIYLQN